MRIEKLTLQNFRLFENREFSFHPQFNLIIGENGSGKSSLLWGLTACISGLMLEFGIAKDEDMPLLSENDMTIKVVGTDEVRFERLGDANVVAILADEGVQAREITLDTSSMFRLRSKLLNLTRDYWPEKWVLDEKYIASLYVFYGCNRLWKIEKQENFFESAMTAKYSRRDGYKDWATAQADSTQLVEWLLKQNIIAFQEKKEPLGWRVLNLALKKCFQDFSHLSFMAKEGDLVVHKVDEKGNLSRQLFKHMSDGQRCMIGLIGDMVRRAVLLNPQLGDKILEETSGVVLIDELDLHLHPKWQRRIIDDLKTTFPKVQFICTTHSPQLIGQAKPEEIIILDQETTRHPAQSYGMDSNWILRHVMGGKDRDPVVAAQLDDIFEDIENANFDVAQSKIIELRKEIGEHPELVEADGLIDRYTRFNLDDIEG